MNASGYIYQPRLTLITNGPDEVPVVRIWSSQPTDHADWRLTAMMPGDPLHWLGLMFNVDQLEEVRLAKAAQTCLQPQHCMTLPDSIPSTWLAMRDLVNALQCDGVHSVMANAELEDLTQALGEQAVVRVDAKFASTAADGAFALQAACQRASTEQARGVVLIRAHASQDFQQMAPWIDAMRSQLSATTRFMYWDVYDPDLQPGQKRFTCLHAAL